VQTICNKYAFCQRDWLQQYANAKSLPKFLQIFASFWSIYFILFYYACARGITAIFFIVLFNCSS